MPVAPMRALLQERDALAPSVRNCLILGARSKLGDYFYEEGWSRLNLLLITAFSRDQEDKIYVQHRMLEHAPEIWHMVHNQGAYIYLSGNAKRMPIDVADALIEIFSKAGGLELEDARRYLKGLENARRFQQECWS